MGSVLLETLLGDGQLGGEDPLTYLVVQRLATRSCARRRSEP
jgi:hypothetical protein